MPFKDIPMLAGCRAPTPDAPDASPPASGLPGSPVQPPVESPAASSQQDTERSKAVAGVTAFHPHLALSRISCPQPCRVLYRTYQSISRRQMASHLWECTLTDSDWELEWSVGPTIYPGHNTRSTVQVSRQNMICLKLLWMNSSSCLRLLWMNLKLLWTRTMDGAWASAATSGPWLVRAAKSRTSFGQEATIKLAGGRWCGRIWSPRTRCTSTSTRCFVTFQRERPIFCTSTIQSTFPAWIYLHYPLIGARSMSTPCLSPSTSSAYCDACRYE